jgi:hypothetical protein
MMMNRRSFSTALLTGAAALLISTRGMAANATPEKARNIVLVHGLFADGSCWSEVIARLQTADLKVTSVQNPLTTLPEAAASAERVLARQDGPDSSGRPFLLRHDRHGGWRASDRLGERGVILVGIRRARRHIDERRDSNPEAVPAEPNEAAVMQSAETLGIEVERREVRKADDLERVFAIASVSEAVLVKTLSLTFFLRGQIAELAARHRLPTVCEASDFIVAGGLMS